MKREKCMKISYPLRVYGKGSPIDPGIVIFQFNFIKRRMTSSTSTCVGDLTASLNNGQVNDVLKAIHLRAITTLAADRGK
jgi:hypothetical protein